MRQKVFGLGIVVFFILGIVFPSFVWSTSVVISACKVQVKMNEIHLSSDGGATYGDNLLSSPSDYITVEPGSSTSIFAYFAQNVQVSAGTYTKVKVVLDPVMKVWWSGGLDGDYWSKENTTPFAQADGQYIDATTNIVNNAAGSGYWYMTLTAGHETIQQDLTLTIAEGQPSTIRVEVYNTFGVSNVGTLGSSYYTSNANPSTSTLIVIQ